MPETYHDRAHCPSIFEQRLQALHSGTQTSGIIAQHSVLQLRSFPSFPAAAAPYLTRAELLAGGLASSCHQFATSGPSIPPHGPLRCDFCALRPATCLLTRAGLPTDIDATRLSGLPSCTVPRYPSPTITASAETSHDDHDCRDMAAHTYWLLPWPVPPAQFRGPPNPQRVQQEAS